MMNAHEVEIRELQPGETHLAQEAIRELRPAYNSDQQFADYVDGVLRPSGYRLLGSFIPGSEQAVAVAGFRVGDSLAWGHYLYLDDLSTSSRSRRQGLARTLLDRLVREGRNLNCGQMHVSAVVGANRFDAHRLYYNCGFGIFAHHFTREL